LASRVIEEYSALEGPLLPILHALQDTFGCIPEPATALIAETLNLSRAEVHGVISFYHDFRRTQPGKLVVKLCRAEACQAMGGPAAAEALLRRFQLDWGGTAADGSLTIDPVYCLGLCAVAPAALVGEAPVGHLNPSHLIERVESAL
jgi:formate dehydrogenase subunit gamma